MAIMAGWGTTAGLLVGTVFFAIGASLLYPALLLLALGGAPESERGSVVGTFSSFFDLSQGLGSLVVGVMVAATSYQGAFALGAGCSLAGFAYLRLHTTRQQRRAALDEEGALAAEHPGP
jgi:predicted MFS family arabinose efflux permease